MIIYPPEMQVVDSDFVFNFVATYHISKIYTQRTMVMVNFTDYKLQTGLSLEPSKVNCTNLTWSVWNGCNINSKSLLFALILYSKKRDYFIYVDLELH